MNKTALHNKAYNLINNGWSRNGAIKVLTTIWDVSLSDATKAVDFVIEYISEGYKIYE